MSPENFNVIGNIGKGEVKFNTVVERSYKQLLCNHVKKDKKTRSFPLKWKSGTS